MNRIRLAAIACAAFLVGCNEGEGQGSVDSDLLYVRDCWKGPFHLEPTFFASDPFADTQQIRIQRGDRMVGVSDGVLLVVNNVTKIRNESLGKALPLGMPVGVHPPGFPIVPEDHPPDVSLMLYLYDTCHLQNGALYSVGGTITFNSLFSGNRNENDADDRLTDATFDATVTDPRDATVSSGDNGEPRIDYVTEHESRVTGNFHFFFERGIPAQPFP
ncbi:MAG TPA: hypothetical protein VHE30_27575 [Polyangiaceae bacterium]|nr:hypothetical protein [Polyangiaceae bacterium]